MKHLLQPRPIPNLLASFLGLLPIVYVVPSFIQTHISPEHWVVTLLTVGLIVPVNMFVIQPILRLGLCKLHFCH